MVESPVLLTERPGTQKYLPLGNSSQTTHSAFPLFSIFIHPLINPLFSSSMSSTGKRKWDLERESLTEEDGILFPPEAQQSILTPSFGFLTNLSYKPQKWRGTTKRFKSSSLYCIFRVLASSWTIVILEKLATFSNNNNKYIYIYISRLAAGKALQFEHARLTVFHSLSRL